MSNITPVDNSLHPLQCERAPQKAHHNPAHNTMLVRKWYTWLCKNRAQYYMACRWLLYGYAKKTAHSTMMPYTRYAVLAWLVCGYSSGVICGCYMLYMPCICPVYAYALYMLSRICICYPPPPPHPYHGIHRKPHHVYV
jgi:hypothetical protein